jgi:hypothetical protein
MSDIFNGKGVEIRLGEEDDFLKVKETLTRIGIASKNDKVLYQSCHILHKQGRYSIMHFKELFEMDGKQSNFSEEDRGRRNTITKLLEEWGLLKIVDPDVVAHPTIKMNQLKIISFRDKDSWELISKYSIGKK